ncbi:hypothetical protein [Nitrospirillum amazonense]|uniref:hypothetical protein n=1 Tax=Nitrospirillum amazonense TaxID=28077 RepID=UPI0024121A26|nr:hypothetical protein [Nitrospirillum amazonense]MDG3444649.1 hypothetical protein [Nitrospirillum amazonense]
MVDIHQFLGQTKRRLDIHQNAFTLSPYERHLLTTIGTPRRSRQIGYLFMGGIGLSTLIATAASIARALDRQLPLILVICPIITIIAGICAKLVFDRHMPPDFNERIGDRAQLILQRRLSADHWRILQDYLQIDATDGLLAGHLHLMLAHDAGCTSQPQPCPRTFFLRRALRAAQLVDLGACEDNPDKPAPTTRLN